jgi:hypothetical protein
MKVIDGILYCNVCVYDREEKEITGNDNTDWRKIAIDLGRIESIRDTGDDEREQILQNRAELYTYNAQCFIVDITYDEALKAWLKYRG